MSNPIGTFTPDNLEAGGFPQERDTITIPSGTGVVQRGAILDASGVPVVGGGSPTDPFSIALEDVDATGDEALCTVAYTGDFNLNALSTGADTTPADQKAALRKIGIFIKSPAP
jgi:hypothetical protein